MTEKHNMMFFEEIQTENNSIINKNDKNISYHIRMIEFLLIIKGCFTAPPLMFTYILLNFLETILFRMIILVRSHQF